MNTNKIGIKLADGEFYPVLDDGIAARKRLVVTTVQDEQPSVQIDLYRGEGKTVTDADYVGSLVVEGIPKMAKGEPDIRMDLGLDEDGVLTAFAQEASTGASQSLKVSLEALAEEEKYEVPDFEFSKEPEPSFSDADFEGTDSLPTEADSTQLLNEVRREADEEEALEKPKSQALRIGLVILGLVVLVAALVFVIFKYALHPSQTAKAESVPAAAAAPAPAPAPAAAEAPEPAKAEPPAQEPVAAKAAPEPAPVVEPKAPEPKKKKAVQFKKPGVTYKIKWGDTLWDLSYAYYRDPWVYMRIAKANKIKNPDLIISGHKLWIPAK